MANKLYQIVKQIPVKPKFETNASIADFPGRPDSGWYAPEVDQVAWEKIADVYGLNQDERGWKELVFNLKNPEVLSLDNQTPTLQGNYVTSYDIWAARKGIIDASKIFQLAAIGVVLTRDNQVLGGIRGGGITPEKRDQFASGLFATPPGGSIGFKIKYDCDPITDTNVDEFTEEIGKFEIISQQLLGVFKAFKPGPTGYKFVSAIKTDATLSQIQEVNLKSNVLYQELLNYGCEVPTAKQELIERGLPPDSWEHFPMIGFPNNREALEFTVGTMPQLFSGIGAGALVMYSHSLVQ